MFLEEKIDALKQEFSVTDFRVPFTEGRNILRSIEKEFIIVNDVTKDLNNLSQYFNSWPENIKDKTEIRSINLADHTVWFDRLDITTNYWTVIINRESPPLKHLVYDCKPNALMALIAISQTDFCIIDKKYNWFSYFRVDWQTQQAVILRSGKNPTPFEI